MFNYNMTTKFISYIFIISIIAVLLPQSVMAEPDWLSLYLNGSFNVQDKYHGVNYADFKGNAPGYEACELARKRAIDDLSYGLSVSIRSSLMENLSQKGTYDDENVESSLFVSTRLVLSGVKPEKNWTDKRNRKYWVLVLIDKKDADKQIKDQNFINEVVDRLDKKQNEIKSGIEIISKTIRRNMEIHSNRLNQIESLVQKIDSKILASGNKTKKEYSKILKKIKQLVNTRNQQELILKKSLANRDKKIDNLFKQNEKLFNLLKNVTENIHKDYFLSFVNSDIKNNRNNSRFQIQIMPDRGQGADYYEKERIKFKVKASKDCYIKVYYLSSGSNGKISTLLLPNKEDRKNKVLAGQVKIIGKYGELAILEPFGKDVITVVASEKQFSDIDYYRDKYKQQKITNTRAAVQMRGIGVVDPLENSSDISEIYTNSLATDTCFIVSHKKL